MNELLQQSLERILGDLATHEAVQAAEAEGWAPALWDALADAGMPWVGVPEAAGGSGGTLDDVAVVLKACGAYAVPLPVAETGLLGGRLLVAAGVDLPAGPVTASAGRPGDTVEVTAGDRAHGVLHDVPWASRAGALATVKGDRVIVVRPAECTVLEASNMAGEPRATVRLDGAAAAVRAVPGLSEESLALTGALSRAVLMAGAIDAMVRLTVDYAWERRQFGQPVARFQAVQQHLVTLAEESAQAAMAVDAAVAAGAAAEQAGRPLPAFEVAAARTVCGEAAQAAAAAAHQVHGAIGMTQEYRLHHFTRRLAAWRTEWGTERSWAARVGASVLRAGGDGLWPLLVGDG